jgi:hypothetical protein
VGLPSLALQLGVVALMIFLWRWEESRWQFLQKFILLN